MSDDEGDELEDDEVLDPGYRNDDGFVDGEDGDPNLEADKDDENHEWGQAAAGGGAEAQGRYLTIRKDGAACPREEFYARIGRLADVPSIAMWIRMRIKEFMGVGLKQGGSPPAGGDAMDIDQGGQPPAGGGAMDIDQGGQPPAGGGAMALKRARDESMESAFRCVVALAHGVLCEAFFPGHPQGGYESMYKECIDYAKGGKIKKDNKIRRGRAGFFFSCWLYVFLDRMRQRDAVMSEIRDLNEGERQELFKIQNSGGEPEGERGERLRDIYSRFRAVMEGGARPEFVHVNFADTDREFYGIEEEMGPHIGAPRGASSGGGGGGGNGAPLVAEPCADDIAEMVQRAKELIGGYREDAYDVGAMLRATPITPNPFEPKKGGSITLLPASEGPDSDEPRKCSVDNPFPFSVGGTKAGIEAAFVVELISSSIKRGKWTYDEDDFRENLNKFNSIVGEDKKGMDVTDDEDKNAGDVSDSDGEGSESDEGSDGKNGVDEESDGEGEDGEGGKVGGDVGANGGLMVDIDQEMIDADTLNEEEMIDADTSNEEENKLKSTRMHKMLDDMLKDWENFKDKGFEEAFQEDGNLDKYFTEVRVLFAPTQASAPSGDVRE